MSPWWAGDAGAKLDDLLRLAAEGGNQLFGAEAGPPAGIRGPAVIGKDGQAQGRRSFLQPAFLWHFHE